MTREVGRLRPTGGAGESGAHTTGSPRTGSGAALLDVLFSTALEALSLVDDRRTYLRVNEPATRLLGAPAERILGRLIENFTPHERVRMLQRLWHEFEAAGRLEGEYEVLQDSGHRLPIRFSAVRDIAPGAHLIAALPLPQPGGQPAGSKASARLSRREREILQLVAAGCSARDIAAQLVLSVPTVNTHLRNAYRKLGVRGRAAAVAALLRDEAES